MLATIPFYINSKKKILAHYTDAKYGLFKSSYVHSKHNSKNSTHDICSTNAKLDIVSSLRAKYGESLTRDHIETIDSSRLNRDEKESLRKLKISLANKGRKPWNIGRQHRPDTLERIRERTRLAMHRSDVRERWKASWEPKSHTRETKEKLKSIMLKKEEAKMTEMADWLFRILKFDAMIYKIVSVRIKDTYRHSFNVIWRLKIAKTKDRNESLKADLIKAYLLNLNIHLLEADRKQKAVERIKSRPGRKAKIKKLGVTGGKNHLLESKRESNKKKKYAEKNSRLAIENSKLRSREFPPKESAKSSNSKSEINIFDGKDKETIMKRKFDLINSMIQFCFNIENKIEHDISSFIFIFGRTGIEKIHISNKGLKEKIKMQTWTIEAIVKDFIN
jgi:hypothetical protein